jgi:hypothetical protein
MTKQERLNAQLQVTVWELVFGHGDPEMLALKVERLRKQGAQWDGPQGTGPR